MQRYHLQRLKLKFGSINLQLLINCCKLRKSAQMSKGTVHQTRQQHGWDTTSDDYHAYISKLSRMPSVLHGAPQYPSVRKALNNKVI